jgi:hypothetical protein
MIKCPTCNDTGETGPYGQIDCAAPGCTAATERAALNTLIDALPAMTPYDLQWTAYQLGRAMAEKELRAMLLKIWGHAIELGETDYFDDPQFAKADWAADCAAAAKLIAKHKGTCG